MALTQRDKDKSEGTEWEHRRELTTPTLFQPKLRIKGSDKKKFR